ncbi:hypothetical protein [Uliginosibacterium sediminicola]|uniref:Uncharacterized protein n=1 Tax=Uliginosibacterium sediminicola TaxID=2024550 RepID=A0ABU9Z1S1_9RHOO
MSSISKDQTSAPQQGASRAISIPAGAIASLYLEAGSQLICTEGYVQFELPPQWLGASMLALVRELGAGDTTTLDKGGWLRLQARRQCELMVIEPAPRIAFTTRVLAWSKSWGLRQAQAHGIKPA